ncbi:hypothetical protein V490_08729 [Pseudogymnoascus sp. VKM F-3557]|nr:hypothetical protein V490_08729 [Pseudogymnoascus sp. VKM F-3557]
MPPAAVGETIPAHTSHAVSVSLPTWKANVAYEEGEPWVIDNMKTGYPRFFVNKLITALAEDIVKIYGKDGEQAMLFPGPRTANRCLEFVLRTAPTLSQTSIRIVDLVLDPKQTTSESLKIAAPSVSAVIFPKEFFSVAKQYWQHSGDGISSRRGEFCHGLLQEGLLVEKSTTKPATEEQPTFHKGPKRYRRGASIDKTNSPPKIAGQASNGTCEKSPTVSNADREFSQFVEERFGRNLDVSFLGNAKSAIKRRIAGSLVGSVDLTAGFDSTMDASARGVSGLSEDDVYLYPCGMNSIFNAHQMLLKAREPLKSISFGFPYVDTLKILQKFGPGCLFYGNGSSEDLDDLEKRLQNGERYLALFAEFPGNPLLQSPDLLRIRKLSLQYDFAVVIDETIGNFININVLPHVDIVVSSLTKIFTGECNVMGGSAILNPTGPYYSKLKEIAKTEYEDNYWAEDVLFMERNSRDFISRIDRINHNAEVICGLLSSNSAVKKVYYPKCVPSREFYDACRTPNGGYGGLLSVTFNTKAQAVAFFDRIDTAKGPSLGTNFTLTSPYVVLAHFMELDWASQFGVDPDLVRISIGLEETELLKEIFEEALTAATLVAAMAPMKRARAHIDDGNLLSVETATSSLRSEPQRKRVRSSDLTASTSRAQLERSASPSDVEEYIEPSHATGRLAASTQYELDRDANFAHLEKEDLYDERATKRILARSQTIGANRAADNGIIEEVIMTNFMCHEKLHVTLGPLINFIIGENGSGKSAILTAITICLGGKASATNRGASLKSFIKGDREQANLEIKLKNQGSDGYKPELFGDTIIVERHFSKSGTSGFKVKNAQGRLISTKKSDIEDITEYFQLQIENPMSILTQDSAKQFLNAAAPSQKYKMFLQGVQLEQLDNDYRLVRETMDAMEEKIKGQALALKSSEKRVQLAEERSNTADKNKDLRKSQKKYLHQLAWGQVENEERQLEELQRTVDEAQRNIEKAENDIERREQEYQRHHEAVEQADDSARQLMDGMNPLKDQEQEMKANCDAANQEVANMHQEYRQIRDFLTASKQKVAKIEKDIAEERQRIENANGGAHAEKMADLTAAQQRASQARQKMIEATDDSQLQDSHQKALREYEDSKTPLKQKQTEIERCQERLSSISRDAGQQMAGFDQKIPRLLNMIKNDQGFNETPVGPIGLHIRLIKPVWSNAIERAIGNTLNGFVVTSKADQQRLANMMRQINLQRCPIMIGNKQPIDLRGHEPDSQFDTVLRVLEIDNELIRRQLIINQNIEQTILIEDRRAAMSAMYDGAKPRNVKQCFCLNESRRGWGLRLGYTGASSDRSVSPITPPDGKPRMKTDIESQLSQQRAILQHLRGEFSELEAKTQAFQRVMRGHEQAIQKHKQAKRNAERELQKAEEAIERMQAALDEDNVEDGRLEALNDDLTEAKAEVELHGGSFVQARLAREAQDGVARTRKVALDAIKSQIANHDVIIKKAEDKARRLRQARQVAIQAKNAATERLEDLGVEKLQAERERDVKAEVVADFISKATMVYRERVSLDPGQTLASTEKKYEDVNAAIKRHERLAGGTDQEIYDEYARAKASHENAERQARSLEELLATLKNSYLQRLHKWRTFQSNVSASARQQFTYLLSERGFRGKLTLDHKAKTLTIRVEPDETRRSAEGRATTTLSGGEKSFSNICLLMSVWEAMGSPLRCLDEFDVFMDQVNRDVSTNLIIGAARRAIGRQFILITPTGIGGGAERDNDVKLIRLTDPRQRRIDDLMTNT